MLSTANVHTTSDPQVFWTAFVLPRIATIGSASPRDKTGAVHARRVLNDELSAMHLAMCALRTRCNALAPISALPAEVLVHIFHLYAAMQPPDWQNPRPLGWIEVTHVCRLWRDTAVQFPSLWSDIPFTLSRRWTNEILCRTKAAPISIYLDVIGVSQPSLSLIFDHIPHTRELSLTGPSIDIKTFFDAQPSLSKVLEILELGPAKLNIPYTQGNNYELPGAIAGCRLPSLRRLILRTFWVPWSAPILHSLRYLEVKLHQSSPSAAARYSSSSEELFSALKDMPNLEILSLIECLPRVPWSNGSGSILELPRLKALRLQGPSARCFRIANHLRIPASCQVQVHCSNRSEVADVAEVLPFLMAHIRPDSPDLRPWHTLSISTYGNSSSQIHIWRHSDMLEEERRFSPILDPDFTIYLYNPELERSIRPLKILCQALPLQTIRTVAAYTMMNTTCQDWIDVFGGCANVEEAFISAERGMSFCTALGTVVDGKSVSMSEEYEQGRLFMGKLKVLHLSDVDFSSWASEETNDIPHSLLTGWLTDRQRVEGVPAIDIILQDCDVPKVWVECLKLVAIVSWDGYEGE